MSVTSQPFCLAALAIFQPIFPDEGLLMYLTGSKYSLVGPAVTRHFIGFIILDDSFFPFGIRGYLFSQ